MFQHQNIWLPDGEKHFQEWMTKNGEEVDGKGTYQIKKWRACEPWIKQWRVAVDIGSHVGLWTMQMVKRFQFVHCFEPMEQFRACFFENMKWANNFALHPVALGAKGGMCFMGYDPADSGNTHVFRMAAVNDDDQAAVKMETLDEHRVGAVDFIKVDVEGFEDRILYGAENTLKLWRPCVIVEQKQHKMAKNFGESGRPACAFLEKLGAKLRQEISGDYIYSWDA